MANKSEKKKKKGAEKEQVSFTSEPWIEKRAGLIVIVVVGLGLALFVIWQLYPVIGPEAILWGLGFGGAIWAISGVSYVFNTRVRGRK